MPEEHLQDDKDVEQILKLAVRGAGFSDEEALRQRLNLAAAELGLSDAQVAAAERQYRAQKEHDLELAEFRAEAKRSFMEHFLSYVIVNAGLLGFDLFRDGRISWAFWPLLGWGIAIAFHAVGTFATNTESFQEEFEKWRKERDRKRRRKLKRAAERKAEDS